MWNSQPDRLRLTPQAIVGLVIVLYGLLLTADNLGWFGASRVISFWPLVLIAIGLAMYERAPDAGGRLSAILVMGIGALLTLARIAGWSITVKLIWPLILVGIGTVLIVRALGVGRGAGAGAAGRLDQRASLFAFWSGSKRRISSQAFQHADCTAVMGGIELDLTAASTGGGDAVLDIFALMGGIEIRVPPDWAVSNQVVAIMGGVDDKSTGLVDAKNRLVLRGFVMMGGIEVKS